MNPSGISWLKSIMEASKQWLKFIQSEQQRHQIDIILEAMAL